MSQPLEDLTYSLTKSVEQEKLKEMLKPFPLKSNTDDYR